MASMASSSAGSEGFGDGHSTAAPCGPFKTKEQVWPKIKPEFGTGMSVWPTTKQPLEEEVVGASARPSGGRGGCICLRHLTFSTALRRESRKG